MCNIKYDLNSEFDVEMHKKTFTNYLEVLISPEGRIVYAVPSHQQKLLEVSGYTVESFRKHHPNINDVMELLSLESGYICVWNAHIEGFANDIQCEILKLLQEHGLYKGYIPLPLPDICRKYYQYYINKDENLKKELLDYHPDVFHYINHPEVSVQIKIIMNNILKNNI